MKKPITFTDLETWKECHKLAISVYVLTKKFPKEEIFGLTSQLRRASVSTTSNIAEGFGRKSIKEKSNFWQIAIGSIYEVESQLLLARDIGYIFSGDLEKVENHITSGKKLCYALIRSINQLSSPNLQLP
jgi:four helix bundle protein